MRVSEEFWRGSHGDQWVYNYAVSTFDERRAALGDALCGIGPFASALDLGCNCGVLVPWLQAASPAAAITGIDLSREALEEARRSWPQHEWVLDSIVDWLGSVDRAWDVVVSSSCLAHVAPADIDGVLQAVNNVATRCVVLQEVTTNEALPAEGLSPAGVLEWRYDYQTRLAARGWRCVACVPQSGEPGRPGAVMTFVRTNGPETP